LLSIRALGNWAAKNTVTAAITPTMSQGRLKNFSTACSFVRQCTTPLGGW